jgi:hypothetical protein
VFGCFINHFVPEQVQTRMTWMDFLHGQQPHSSTMRRQSWLLLRFALLLPLKHGLILVSSALEIKTPPTSLSSLSAHSVSFRTGRTNDALALAWKVQRWDAWNVAPERLLVAEVVENAAAADLLPYFSAKPLLKKHVTRVLQQIEGKSTKMVGFVQIRPFSTTTTALGDPSSSLHKTVDDSTLY